MWGSPIPKPLVRQLRLCDSAAVGGRLSRVGDLPGKQGFDGLAQVAARGRALPESDVVEGAAVAQHTGCVDHEKVGGGYGPVQPGDSLFCIV